MQDFFEQQILEELPHIPTTGQREFISILARMMLTNPNEDAQLAMLCGYAGTGKTTLIAAFVRTLKKLKQSFVLLAPTGRAAKVLSEYAAETAYTIHKKIYRQKTAQDINAAFLLDHNSHTNTTFIVDEASMIADSTYDSTFGTGNLLFDLLNYVYSGRSCRLLLIGDTAQLPPVGQAFSPAMHPDTIYGYAPCKLQIYKHELTEVVRQANDSGILSNATELRAAINEKAIEVPTLQTTQYKDIIRLPGNELIDTLSSEYDRYDITNTAVICRSNIRANRYNAGIRSQILFKEERLTVNDNLMVVRNNYFWIKDDKKISFIANGDTVQVLRIGKYTERYGFQFVEADLYLQEYDREFSALLLLDTLESETASLSNQDSLNLYRQIMEDYAHLPSQKKRLEALREDKFYNALQVKYAYAITCHKAQGGQWPCVFLDYSKPQENADMTEYLRWLYTATTRASQKLYLINFPDQLFGE